MAKSGSEPNHVSTTPMTPVSTRPFVFTKLGDTPPPLDHSPGSPTTPLTGSWPATQWHEPWAPASPTSRQSDSNGAKGNLLRIELSRDTYRSKVRSDSLSLDSILQRDITASAERDPPTSGTDTQNLKVTHQLLGKGTFSEVYKGLMGDQIVAVKVPRKGMNIALELSREAAIMQRLVGHENIVPLIGISIGNEGTSLIMPLYETTIESIVKTACKTDAESMIFDFSRMTQPVCGSDVMASWIKQLDSALKFIHSHEIVHGDLKPDNLLCSNGKLAICDFASAIDKRDDSPAEARTGLSVGAFSPSYTSPSVRAGKQPDFEDDFYSMSCILMFCATGREPYSAATSSAQRIMWMSKVNPGASYSMEDQLRWKNYIPEIKHSLIY